MRDLASRKMFSSWSPDSRTISFAEVVKDRKSDVKVTDDRLIYAVELVMVMSNQTRDHAGKTIRNLSEQVFQSEKISQRQMSTHGGAPTKLLTFQHAIELVMVLPGKVAKEVRTKFADIIRRYYAGDKTLVGEIETNAASDHPINRLARGSMQAEEKLGLTRKRRKEELEIELLEAEVATKKLNNATTVLTNATVVLTNAAMELTNAAMARDSARDSDRDHLTKVTIQYNDLCNNTVIDERARLMLKDGFLNMAMAAQQGLPTQCLIQNGPNVSPNKPISITSVAKDLGLVIPDNEYKSIGIKVSNCYNKLYGKRPEKHDQIIGGKVIPVCNYVESDRPLMEEVLREHCADK